MVVLMAHLRDEMLPLLMSMKAANVPPPAASSDWNAFLKVIAADSTCSLKKERGTKSASYLPDSEFVKGVQKAGKINGEIMYSCHKGGGVDHIFQDIRSTTNKHYESLKVAAIADPGGKTIIRFPCPRIIVVVWLMNEALKGNHAVRDYSTWDKVCGNSLTETMAHLADDYDRVIWICGGRSDFFGCDE